MITGWLRPALLDRVIGPGVVESRDRILRQQIILRLMGLAEARIDRGASPLTSSFIALCHCRETEERDVRRIRGAGIAPDWQEPWSSPGMPWDRPKTRRRPASTDCPESSGTYRNPVRRSKSNLEAPEIRRSLRSKWKILLTKLTRNCFSPQPSGDHGDGNLNMLLRADAKMLLRNVFAG